MALLETDMVYSVQFLMKNTLYGHSTIIHYIHYTLYFLIYKFDTLLDNSVTTY
jgi:hypothetical protein